MTDYGAKIQALMDEMYSEWQKEENKSKGKWDILGGLSQAHQIATVLGNFNYQVENGGIEQWIYNGYFQDDAEKLIEYLEIGAETDERCRTILEKIYTLDQYAQETDCDRYGNYRDPYDEDGEESFVGDIIDCDKFDTWYYERCGKDDWWKTVCGIIDEVNPLALAQAGQHERDVAPEQTIRVEYVYSGANNERLSEIVDFPASQDRIEQLLKNAGIDGLQERILFMESINSVVPGLGDVLVEPVSPTKINILAEKISVMDSDKRIKFNTFIADGQRCGSYDDLLNLAENIGGLEFQPKIKPLQVYIENVHDNRIGGFTMPLPTTLEALQPFLEGAEIKGWQDMEIVEVTSDIAVLGETLTEYIKKTMSPETLDELNYLAARIVDLQRRGNGYEMFAAAFETGRYHGNMAELINLTLSESLNRFDLHPAFTDEQYGDFLIEFGGDEHADAFNRLNDSGEPGDRELARYIEKLEKYVDRSAYGRDAIKEADGTLTENGLLMGGRDIQSIYRGSRDIPAEHRLFTQPGEVIKPLLKLDDVDIAATIMKMHVVCNGSMDYAAGNLDTLLKGQDRDYLLLVNRSDVCLYPAIEAYKCGTEVAAFLSLQAKASMERPGFMAFAVRVNDRGDKVVTGDLVELNGKALYENISRHAVVPDRVDAVFSNGAAKSYDVWSWAELPVFVRDDIREYEPHFPDDKLAEAAKHYASFTGANEMVSEAVSSDVFLPEVNTAYMAAAENPQPDMIRVGNDAAKEILARSDADVYKLTPTGAEKLRPIEAARALCFAENKDLAINRGDIAGLDKWAERKVDKMTRQKERGEHKKSDREEL